MSVQNSAECVGEIITGVHVGHLAGSYERSQHCPVLGADFVAREEYIFSCQCYRPDLIFHGIGVELERAIIQTADQPMEPHAAIETFFAEIVKRSLDDTEHKGCMLVNAALDIVPHDPAFQQVVAGVLLRIEAFFLRNVKQGQTDGSITTSHAAEDLARHLVGILMGVRVLARVRPDRALLEGAVRPSLALLAVDKADAP